MNDELTRIMKLVREGKLSPEDAAELVEAFATAREEGAKAEEPTEAKVGDGPPPPPPPPKAKTDDPFAGILESIEKIGKDVATSVNWSDISAQIREGARKGVEAVKQAAEQARQGKFSVSFFGSQETKELRLPLAVPAGKTLRIENVAGDVVVQGKKPLGSVTAHATIRGLTHEEARQRAETFSLVIEESDHMVTIRQPDLNGVTVDLTVDLADPTPVEVRCESGDVRVLDTGSSCRIEGRSGDVRLSGLDGAVDVATMSGDVSISQCSATTVTVEGKSGDQSLEDVKGTISLRTASGDVRLTACAGPAISIEAAAGDVSVDLVEPVRGAVNVRTVNGDVRVSVPDGGDARVALATLRGDVTCGLELQDEVRADQRITGRLGDGSGTLDVSAVTGDVSLQPRNHE